MVRLLLVDCTDLREADLTGADLQGTDLSGADLRGAVLSGAKLQGANLWRAELQGAGLWSAACCYFAAPPRPTDSVPGGFDAETARAPVGIVHPIALLSSVFGAPLTLDFLLEDRAGPPPPRLLTSVLLI